MEKYGSKISDNVFTVLPKLSLVYLNLNNDENDLKNNTINDGIITSLSLNSNNFLINEAMQRNSLNFIHSEVDWSEFYTHKLYDTVIAKIERINNITEIEKY